MDVNVTPMAVYIAASVEVGLQAVQPENAIGDQRVRVSFAICGGHLAAFKNCADRLIFTYFFRYPMQA